jgi:hypothetical protein
MDDAVRNHAAFSNNRDRLNRIAQRFFAAVSQQDRRMTIYADHDHFADGVALVVN